MSLSTVDDNFEKDLGLMSDSSVSSRQREQEAIRLSHMGFDIQDAREALRQNSSMEAALNWYKLVVL